MFSRQLLAAMIGSWLLASSSPSAAEPLLRSTPEAQGVSSHAIREFVRQADKIDTLHSFMIFRHGSALPEDAAGLGELNQAVTRLEAHPAKRAR